MAEPTEEEIRAYVERHKKALRGRAVLPFLFALACPVPFVASFFYTDIRWSLLILTGVMSAATLSAASAEHHYAAATGVSMSPWEIIGAGARGFVDVELWRKSFTVRLLAIALLPPAIGGLVALVWRYVFGSGGR